MSDTASRSSDPRLDVAPILPDNWKELAPLVDAVLDTPVEQRASVIAQISGGDAARQADIERLVAECEQDAPMLNRPAAERFARLLAEESDVALPETLGGRYRIERELGRGGMARVYLARDSKHARNVAVKVIRPDLAASLGRDRFLREIAIAARLRHPNIVPVYDSGDADGLLYFVMPYEEGPSLRGRLALGQSLTVGECVSTLRDVARALVYAHANGVVHRDVKPDNVMLSGGAAVVTDFGIAKAVSAAQADAPSGTLTQGGAGIGTPAYMAPEQAIGDPSTDHRADIYSFGCLAYELFAGNPPFHGLPSHQIIAAHVGTKPTRLADVCSGVPSSIAALIDRCLEKNPAARPQSAQDVLTYLEESQTGPNVVVRKRRRFFPLAWLLAAAAVVVVVAGLLVVRAYRAPALTLAVLPFASVGGDSTQDELADGLTDEVATGLFRVHGIRIMSRGTVAKYRGVRDIIPREVSDDLGARLLVMGALRWTPNGFTINATLHETHGDSIIWADNFSRTDGDYTAAIEEVVSAIERELRNQYGQLLVRRSNAPKRYQPSSTEAQRYRAIGVSNLGNRGLSVREAANAFRRATEIDSLFPQAYSGLSFALALTPYFHATSAKDVAQEARATADRALRLDSTLAEPHVALALVAQHANDWETANREFRIALDLRDENEVEPLVQYGRHLVLRGRLTDGLAKFIEAKTFEPASALVSSWAAYAYYLRGEIDSALVLSDRAYENDAKNMTTLAFGSLIRLKAGRRDEAREFALRVPPQNPVALYVLATLGDTAELNRRVAVLRTPTGEDVWFSNTARAFVALGTGDTTRAMDFLERATDANEHWPSHESLVDPLFDTLRGSARFDRLLRRINLGDIGASQVRQQRQ